MRGPYVDVALGRGTASYLQHLQLLQALLYQFLDLPLVVYALVLPKCISCPPLCIVLEIVRCELFALTKELPILCGLTVNITT